MSEGYSTLKLEDDLISSYTLGATSFISDCEKIYLMYSPGMVGLGSVPRHERSKFCSNLQQLSPSAQSSLLSIFLLKTKQKTMRFQ